MVDPVHERINGSLRNVFGKNGFVTFNVHPRRKFLSTKNGIFKSEKFGNNSEISTGIQLLPKNVKDDEARCVREHTYVSELYQWPFDIFCFAVNHGHGAHALHRESVKDHER